jgi:hypothetical protein
MLVTYIPWAEARGAVVLDRCQDARVVTENKMARGVRFRRDGQEIFAQAERVVVCCGAVGSSEVLLQSGVHLEGRVGQGLHVLGGVFVSAETEEVQDGFDGIGLTSVAHASPDYVIESYFAPPVVFSMALGGWFLTHFRRMQRYRYFAQAGVMVGTQPTGTIRLDKKGRARIKLEFSADDLAKLKQGLRTLSSIFLAGGASRVILSSYKLLECSNPDELGLIDEQVRRPDDLLLGSAHPQGATP